MTEAEAVEVCREHMGRAEAEAKVRRGLEDEPLPPSVVASGRGDGLDRSRAAIRTIRLVHGLPRARARERQLSRREG